MLMEAAYLLFSESVRVAVAPQVEFTVYVPAAVTLVVARFATWVQLAVTLPCPSKFRIPATSNTPVTEAPDKLLPLALNSCTPVKADGQVAGCALPVPL